MPLICMTKAIGSKIGESLGILEEVDIEGDGVEWGSVLRIRVIIDIQKPLERGRSLTIAGKAHWVNFKYENLPVFCFFCGRIVHGDFGCTKRTQTDLKKEWGVWLRAEKSNRQGTSRSLERKSEGPYQGNNSGDHTMGGGNLNVKGSSGFGGKPMPSHQPHMGSSMDSQSEATGAANQAKRGFREDHSHDLGERFQETQSQTACTGVFVKQLAAPINWEGPNVTKWAQQRGYGPNKAPHDGYKDSPHAYSDVPAE